MKNLTDWQRFKLLTWKNFMVLKSNPRDLLFDVFLPIVFWIAIIIIRIKVNPHQVETHLFHPVDFNKSWLTLKNIIENRRKALRVADPNFNHNVFVPQLIIAYAPYDYADFLEIMEEVKNTLPGVTLKQFSTCQALRRVMMVEHYFAGICFHDIVSYDYAEYETEVYPLDDDEKLDNLNYTIVVPSELRIFEDFVLGNTWPTYNAFSPLSESNTRIYVNDEDGTWPGYIREGVIPLQDAIYRAFLKYRLNDITKLPKVTLQRYPYGGHMYDEMTGALPLTLTVLIVLGFLCPVIRVTWRIAREKQKAIKAYMRASGIKSWIYYASWFMHGLFIFVCNAIVLVLVLMLKWNDDSGILRKSSSFGIFVMLVTYCFYASAYAILIAGSLSSTFLSVTLAGSLWIFTTIPIITLTDYRSMTTSSWFCYCLFPNTAMGLIAFRMFEDDVFHNGFNINEIFSYLYPYEEVNVGHAMSLYMIHAMLYMILVLLLEKLHPNFTTTSTTLHKLLIKSNKVRVESGPTLDRFQTESTKVFEIEAEYRKELAVIENVTKVYHNVEVVKGVSLNLYEDNITVLLGHNGCGKTTLLRMIMGVEPLTNGRIVFDGYDLSGSSKQYRPHLGGSLRDELLYDDLTVENQILFYSRLKGMSWKQASFQVDKYCDTMDLSAKRRVITKKLTIGLRHQLAVCCALAGESKIVILDEPNYGMDLTATRQILELLEVEKKHRTILLSTKSSKLADAVADRVAIMAKGELKCSGSIVFLKNIYSIGQRLYIIKGKECNTEKVTEFLSQFMPDIAVESELGHSLNYLINNRHSHMIGNILQSLERDFRELGIETYAIDDVSIDDVVMSLGTKYPDDFDPFRQTRILNGETPYTTAAYEAFDVEYTIQKTWLNNFRAQLSSRLIFATRNKWETIGHMLLPVLCISLAFLVNNNQLSREMLPSITFSFETYDRTISIRSRTGTLNDDMTNIYDNFGEAIFWLKRGHTFVDIGEHSIVEYALEKQNEEIRVFHSENLGGVEFTNDTMHTFFNNYMYHTAPLILNMAYNAIARATIDKFSTITVHMHPLNYTTGHDSTQLVRKHDIDTSIVLTFLLGFLFSWNVSVYYITLERTSRYRLVMRIAGAKLKNYWLCTFLFDIISNMTAFTLVAIGIFIYNSLSNSRFIGYTYLSLLLGCITIHSVHYVFARLSKSAIDCYNTVLMFDCMGIIAFFFMSELNKAYDRTHMFKMVYHLFVFHPYFAMANMVRTLYFKSLTSDLCDDPVIKVLVLNLNEETHLQCNDIPGIFGEGGVFREFMSLVVLALMSWLLLLIIELHKKWLNFWIFAVKPDNSEYSWEDYKRLHKLDEPDDVERERIKLDTQKPAELHKRALVMNRVGKTFGIFEALHRLCFTLERSSICCVLGANGSGKSLLLDMINTNTRYSYGKISVKGVNVAHDPFKVIECISYCPETLEGFQMYTPCEILEILATLRGVPHNIIGNMCQSMAKVLGFFDEYDRVIRTCSRGIQKRVGCALALISQPDLILLDDPSSALDTYGQLLLRNVLSHVRRNGSTVLFTSTNPEECQFFCDKILIFMTGRLIACGSIQDIFKSCDYGYDLIIRVKPLHSVTTSSRRYDSVRFTNADSIKLRLITLVQTSFQNVILRHAGELLISFIIPKSNNIGIIYSTIKANSFSYSIESFGVFRSSMETIYLQLFHKNISEYY